MKQAYIGLGSNMGDGPALIHAAIKSLEDREGISGLRLSSLYRTAAWGYKDQPDFTNAVAELQTALSELELLRTLLEIENELGRRRSSEKWGPRSIDLDLLLFEQGAYCSAELELPHPRMHLRKFVLAPLVELNAKVNIPGVGPAADSLARVEKQQIEKIK